MKYGQANLAYIRMGFYMAFALQGNLFDPYMVAINTARKSATGKGTRPMWELIPWMNHNAADSLGCALHAIGYRAEK